MTTTPNPAQIEQIASRLRVLEAILGMSSSAIADAAGIARNTYSQWRKGKGRPQLDQAVLLCDRFGITLDWIYLGSTSGLPYQFMVRLDKITA